MYYKDDYLYKICLSYTSEKFKLKIQIFQDWTFWKNIETLRTLYEVTASTIKKLLLHSGFRKDVAVSVNKESMSKSISKNVFLSF